MKTLSKGSRFAIYCLVGIGLIAVVFGFYDRYTEGSAPGVFPFAGLMFALAILTYVLSKRTDGRATLLLLPLLAAAASCTRPTVTADAKSERARPDTVATFTNAQGFEEPVAAR